MRTGTTFRSSLALVLALMVTACGDSCRCHTGHYEVKFYPEEVSTSMDCDDDGCTVSTDVDPAHCSIWLSCDLHCKDIDKGKLEAHDKHEMLVTPLVNYSPQQCTDAGQMR